LSGPKRYDHFIKVVADEELVWGLYKDGWALAATDANEQAVFPVWPLREYAELCNKEIWSGYEPKSICLNEYMDEILPDLEDQGTLPCIFYLPTDKGVIPTIEQLTTDIKAELSRYE